MTWAASLHRTQVRENTKVPYFAHLVAVSSFVLEDGGKETEAIAGLLHDAVEDCDAGIEPNLPPACPTDPPCLTAARMSDDRR